MPHPRLDNRTPFTVAPLYFDDEHGRPALVVVVKATFGITGEGLGLWPEQPGLVAEGECYGDDPETSCYRLEPEVAPFKPTTDVIVLGHACAPRVGTTSVDLGVRVGPVQAFARVFGDRLWYRGATGFELTAPRPFERIPVTFERAFGGWDRSPADPSDHEFEARNPVGRGFHGRKGREHDQDYAPNIEDLRHLITAYRDRPPRAAASGAR